MGVGVGGEVGVGGGLVSTEVIADAASFWQSTVYVFCTFPAWKDIECLRGSCVFYARQMSHNFHWVIFHIHTECDTFTISCQQPDVNYFLKTCMW